MVMYKKVFEPGETSRRLNVIVRLPETLTGLAEIPYRQEALLIDYILQQWMLSQTNGKPIGEASADGTLRKKIESALYRARESREGAPALASGHPIGALPGASEGDSRAVNHPVAQRETVDETYRETKNETHREQELGRVDAHPPLSQRDGLTSTAEGEPHSGDGDHQDGEPPAPPVGIAARLNGMFDT